MRLDKERMLACENLEQVKACLGREPSVGEKLWFNYSAKKPDAILHYHILFLFCLFYSVFPLPYLLLDLNLNWFKNKVGKYKIQPKAPNKSFSHMLTCYTDVIKTTLLVAGPLQLLLYSCNKWVGIRTSLPLPSGWEVCLQLFIYFVLEDFSHYWLHRLLLHSKWGYQNIHRVHHEFTAPIGLAAPYVHWAELIILGFPQILGPAIAPGHMVTYWLWFILREMVATETHCGYSFPWSPSKFIPFYGGAEFHDYHHRVGNESKGNFASIFRYCDLIYGTDKGYRYKKNTTGKEPSISISNFTLKMHE